jgi:hypothetical protein
MRIVSQNGALGKMCKRKIPYAIPQSIVMVILPTKNSKIDDNQLE